MLCSGAGVPLSLRPRTTPSRPHAPLSPPLLQLLHCFLYQTGPFSFCSGRSEASAHRCALSSLTSLTHSFTHFSFFLCSDTVTSLLHSSFAQHGYRLSLCSFYCPPLLAQYFTALHYEYTALHYSILHTCTYVLDIAANS